MTGKHSLRSSQIKPRQKNQQKCEYCDEIVNDSDLRITCADCHCTYHIECAGMETKQYRALKQKEKWTCDNHEEKDDDENQNRIEKKLDNIGKQLKDLTKSQEFVSAKHDDVIEQLKLLREENKSVRQEIATLKKQQHQMRSDIDQLKAKLNIFEQQKTGDKVIVRGVKKEEDATEAVKKIAAIIDVNLDANDIIFANQITAEKKTPTITAKFSSQQKKNEFVKAAKKKRLSTQMYGYDGECKPIFVDEQLTKYTYSLFAQAKELKKVGIKYVWVSNGDVLYKQSDDSQTKRISSSMQINDIEKAIMLSKKKATSSKTHQQAGTSAQRHNNHNSERGQTQRRDQRNGASNSR